MDCIIIKKDGATYIENRTEFKSIIEKCKNLRENLSCEVKIEEGLTFRILFELILKEKKFFNTLFKKELGKTKLEMFENRIKKDEDIEGKEEETPFDYLEILKTFEIIGDIEEGDINFYPAFIGIKKSKEEDDEDIVSSINLIPINILGKFEIIVNNKFEGYNLYENAEGGMEVSELDIYGRTPITLYELIWAILYEIAYYGTPEQKDMKREQMASEIPWNALKDELQLKFNKYILEEEFEKAAEVKQSMSELEKKSKNIRFKK